MLGTRARRMNENNWAHVRQIPIHHLHSEIDIDLRGGSIRREGQWGWTLGSVADSQSRDVVLHPMKGK